MRDSPDLGASRGLESGEGSLKNSLLQGFSLETGSPQTLYTARFDSRTVQSGPEIRPSTSSRFQRLNLVIPSIPGKIPETDYLLHAKPVTHSLWVGPFARQRPELAVAYVSSPRESGVCWQQQRHRNKPVSAFAPVGGGLR